MVAGYVIMRVATIALWLRIARHDAAHRRSALTYAVVVGIIQVGWVVTIFINPPLNVMFGIIVVPRHARAGLSLPDRAPGGRHAVACPPHRRALRAARHHHPRRGRARHDPRDLGSGRGAGLVGRGRPRGVRRHAPRVRHVVGVLHDALGQGADAVPRARVHLGLRALLHLRFARGDRCGAARGGLRDRRRRAHRHGRGAAHGRRARRWSSRSRCSPCTRCCCGSSTRSTSGSSSAASSCS